MALPWPSQLPARCVQHQHQQRCFLVSRQHQQHQQHAPVCRATQQQQQQPQQQQQQQQQPVAADSLQQQQQQQPVSAADSLHNRLSKCPVCFGTGRVPCKDCGGHGYLPRGGYSRKNPLNMSRAVGSKWTAMVETLGWRHFRVTAVKSVGKGASSSSSSKGKTSYLLLQASCDHSVELWVSALTLRNRACWAAGWLSMSELVGEGDGLLGGAAGNGRPSCHSCSGVGSKACTACNGRGRAELVDVV